MMNELRLILQTILWTVVVCCEFGEFKCDNARCIERSFLCDSDDDCGDFSDESNRLCSLDLCPKNFVICGNTTFCYHNKAHCDRIADCPNSADEKNCTGSCIGQPDTCSRRPAYSPLFSNVLRRTLIYTDGIHVYKLGLSEKEEQQRLTRSGLPAITALAYSSHQRMIFWTSGAKLYRTRLDGAEESQEGPMGELSANCSVTNMAFDWITQNFYFVCEKNRVLACSVKKGSIYCAVIAEFGRFNISSIALDAADGLMLLNGHVDSEFRIYEVFMDGSSSMLIHQQEQTQNQSAQTLSYFDIVHREVLISDGLTLNRSDFHMKSLHRVENLFHFGGVVAILPNLMIFKQRNGNYQAFLFRLDSSRFLTKRLAIKSDARFITLFDEEDQAKPDGPNYCENSKCGHLCLLHPGGALCLCDLNYKLMSDNRTCCLRNNSEICSEPPEPDAPPISEAPIASIEQRDSSRFMTGHWPCISAICVTLASCFIYIFVCPWSKSRLYQLRSRRPFVNEPTVEYLVKGSSLSINN